MDALSQPKWYRNRNRNLYRTSFLKTLEGGCTAPIELCKYNEEEDTIHFQGVLFSLDGKEKIEVDKIVPIEEWKKLGFYLPRSFE
jgi:hydroxymethylbilane synthase